MQDAAVVAALMSADGGLFFKHRDARIGKTLAEPPGGAKSDDASADDYDAIAILLPGVILLAPT